MRHGERQIPKQSRNSSLLRYSHLAFCAMESVKYRSRIKIAHYFGIPPIPALPYEYRIPKQRHVFRHFRNFTTHATETFTFFDFFNNIGLLECVSTEQSVINFWRLNQKIFTAQKYHSDTEPVGAEGMIFRALSSVPHKEESRLCR